MSAPQREGLFDRVFQGSAVGMAVARLEDGTVLEANDAFCYLIGRGLPDLLGADVFALGVWGDLGAERARDQLRTRGMVDGFDTTVGSSELETRVIRLWAELVEDADPIVILRASDVDGRVAAGTRYSELREAEIRFRALVEQMPAITFTQFEEPRSPTGFRIAYVSPQTERILGYTAEEWLEDVTLWIAATHPEDRDRVLAADQRSAMTGEPFREEYRMVARDGRTVWFQTEAAPVEDPASGLRFWQGVMMDVTRDKKAAEHHAEVEAKYRNLVEQLPAVVYLGEYGEEGDWIYISPQIERVMGYTPREWLDHPAPMGTFTHPDDIERVREDEARSYRTGTPLRSEYRMQRRDGRWIWILDEASVVRDPEDRPLFLQGLMYDITERKEAEERLMALDRLKNTLLHTLSHDLKEPLTAILGAASTLERLDHELSEEERRQLLRTLASRTQGMNALLTDLLDLDRLDRGIVEPRRFPVNLGALVHGIVERNAILRERTVQLDGSGCVANVDAAKVERLLENLLSNAARHTPKGTPILVRLWRDEEAVQLAVDDEGPGVPDELKEAIFEPFRRGPDAGSDSGSGIGLSLVARFAELHGGRTWVEDRPGGGASFRVTLPDGDPVQAPS
ncbi:MAG TPA: PAS domain-containing protein [Actinomycetota bacterium]|nr:PAS domain-containing protein [Actinomycetota bacterium]